MDMLGSEAQLRSKRELIERFIEQHMPKAQDSGASVEETFLAFWNDERVKAMEAVCAEEGIARQHFSVLLKTTSLLASRPYGKPSSMCWSESQKSLNARRSLSGSSTSCLR